MQLWNLQSNEKTRAKRKLKGFTPVGSDPKDSPTTTKDMKSSKKPTRLMGPYLFAYLVAIAVITHYPCNLNLTGKK